MTILREPETYIRAEPKDVLQAHRDNPGLALRRLGWCKECFHFAVIYHVGTDQLKCHKCNWESPLFQPGANM